jgi:hypothetical protein
MKKTIAILLVLVIGMVGVWAANPDFTGYTNSSSATIDLSTEVAERTGVKIATTGISGTAMSEKVSSFLALTQAPDLVFTDANLDETIYVSYLTNKVATASVKVTATALATETTGVTTEIGYSVSIGGATAIEVPALTSGVELTFYNEASDGNGMRVDSKQVDIVMDYEDWISASADDYYETTWTINLVQI